MPDKATIHAGEHFQRYLDQLCQFLSIPSISTLSEHRDDIERAAVWLAEDLKRVGLQKAQLMQTAGNPVVYGEWLGAGPDSPTVLIYGHYDVQPADPLSLWHSPPFEPSIREGLLYARGASDNKSQHFSHIKAVESMLAVDGRLPLNIKFCLDGEEEVGSPNLESFVADQRELLAADLVLVSDGAMISPDQPTIDYALRGVVSAEIRVRGPERDLHSGSFGGSVHNPAQALAEIIAALHFDDGRVAIPGFYDNVLLLDETERALLAAVPYSLQQWRQETGVRKPWGEPNYTLLERMTARPTCEVNGIFGGFQGEGMRTIIPSEAGAKISMRLVADQDAGRIGRLFVEYVQSLAPDSVTVTVTVDAGANAAVTAYDSPWIQAVVRAYEDAWGATPVLSRGGGSLPIIATFQKELGVPFVLMPFGLDDNRHSPNEHYRLEALRKGIATAIRTYHYLGQLRPGH